MPGPRTVPSRSGPCARAAPTRSAPRSGTGRWARRALRAVAVGTATLVTVLAAAPPESTAAPAAGPPAVHGAASGGATSPGATSPGATSPGARFPDATGLGVRAGPGAPGQPPPEPPDPDAPDSTAAPAPGSADPPRGADGPPAGSVLAPPVRPPGAGRRAPGAAYAWPLVPVPEVATPFRRPTFRFGRGHRGADLAGTAGHTVLAAREGVVVFAGRVAGRPVVSVDHPDGLRTTYEPVEPVVAAGTRVAVGDPLGVLVGGHAGCAGPCLHWGVRRGKVDYLDPLVLVRPPRLRLLPLDGLDP